MARRFALEATVRMVLPYLLPSPHRRHTLIRSTFLLLLTSILVTVNGLAQTVDLDVLDEPSGRPMAFDSIVVVRSLDDSRWVTTDTKITLPVTSVESESSTEPTISLRQGHILVRSQERIDRLAVASMNGQIVSRTAPNATEGSVSFEHLARGLYAIQVDGAHSSLRRLVYLDPSSHSYLCEGRGKHTGRILGTEEFTFTVYIGDFVSRPQVKMIDPADAQALTLSVERPLWTDRVVSIQVIDHYTGTVPSIAYDQELYPGRDASGLTKAWSFSPDEDSYEIDGDLISGSLVYTIGNESSSALEVVFLSAPWTTTAYSLIATDRPHLEDTTITFRCSNTMPITYYYRDEFSDIERENDNCDGRSLVFTLE